MASLTLTRPYQPTTDEIDAACEAQDTLLGFACWTFPAYQRARHLELLARELEAIERGENDRLMVFMPPRHGKSELVSIRFPAWYMGRHSERMVIMASYGGELAQGFGGKTRNVLATDRFGDIFGDVSLAQDSRAANLWRTQQGGQMLSAGVGGGITGYGAHLLLIDDPIKKRAEAVSETYRKHIWNWYRSEAYERLEPGGAIVLVMTRWHEDDLAGRLLIEEEAGGDRWRVLSLPALAEAGDILGRETGAVLWPERYGADELARIRQVIGASEWAALYQQRPRPQEGALFKWWPTYDEVPSLKQIVIGIDTAYTDTPESDYTAWAAWGDDGAKRYLMGAGRYRGEVPTAELRLHNFYQNIRNGYPKTPIRALIRRSVAIDRVAGQHLRMKDVPVVDVKLPAGKTAELATLVSPEFESGKALIPAAYSPWLDEWLEEHKGFPFAAHDDWVETTVLALWYCTQQPRAFSGEMEMFGKRWKAGS